MPNPNNEPSAKCLILNALSPPSTRNQAEKLEKSAGKKAAFVINSNVISPYRLQQNYLFIKLGSFMTKTQRIMLIRNTQITVKELMTMDLEMLINEVAERVMQRLKLQKAARQARIPEHQVQEVTTLLDNLAAGNTVHLPGPDNRHLSVRVPVITMHQLCKLYTLLNGQTPRKATITAGLRQRGIRPFKNPDSQDSRSRVYIDKRQTQAFVLPPYTGELTLASVVAECQELSAKCPELCDD